MNYNVDLLDTALVCLNDIQTYIAQDDPYKACQFIDTLEEKITKTLSTMPTI